MIFPCWEEGIPWWRFSLPGDFFMEKMQIRPLIVSLLIRCVFPIAAGNHQSLPAADWGVSFRREQHWGESKWGQKSDFSPVFPCRGGKNRDGISFLRRPIDCPGVEFPPEARKAHPRRTGEGRRLWKKSAPFSCFLFGGGKKPLLLFCPEMAAHQGKHTP